MTLALLGLFLAQFYPPFQQYEGLLLLSGVYVLSDVGVLVIRRKHLPRIVASVRWAIGGADAASTTTDYQPRR